ncbi:hypothetical protein PHYBLDRAFT_67395 [Phycomyces blakesleeanus NRRL 1555(-)]|uniref:Secreted protein n=1 Tax=Phycomyces blakesleeanus (strain ATCC 8743b / DSM 1359 / FGSC 10004 / NBRC 33097 / NRRL 1555) TaxID=763407 RepID=A0A162WE70_PHYB8|nr:hypothetical protein PHYBLDRAFT_67395 [Phycomyces blakesleeanus NRRL 1555(-)]OAD66515.1 hypothetical protein PHYBLDRAFT_67395 [Phycomyces blakesleeanus NRRL 1555(-)]|eukprot:XP_018284555.1 hypothetical protein PHYBLDRAFT_67395 [Phycomyces blakesleeanus NRRL 1555(-)]
MIEWLICVLSIHFINVHVENMPEITSFTTVRNAQIKYTVLTFFTTCLPYSMEHPYRKYLYSVKVASKRRKTFLPTGSLAKFVPSRSESNFLRAIASNIEI